MNQLIDKCSCDELRIDKDGGEVSVFPPDYPKAKHSCDYVAKRDRLADAAAALATIKCGNTRGPGWTDAFSEEMKRTGGALNASFWPWKK